MYDLLLAIGLDIFIVLFCLFLLARHGRLAHSHPGTIYLFFHLYVVTARLWAVFNGAPTLFTWGWPFLPVTESEIIRAAFLYDMALVVMTIAWLKAASDDSKQTAQQPSTPAHSSLSLKYIWWVVIIVFPLGVLGLLLFTQLPGITLDLNFGVWERSTWLSMLPTWSGLALLALIYWYGPRPSLIFLMTIYLGIMAYQGFHRFRIIIPLILLTQIYLDRQNRRWPTIPVLFFLLMAGLLFFPLKTIGNNVQQGRQVLEIVNSSSTIINEALRGRADDQEFLDQFASGLTLADYSGKFYYGLPYLYLLILPIPRPLWPDKPSFASYIMEISTPTRPMGESGMIVTFLGEAYINFGYVGVVLIPYFFAYYLGLAYFHAYRQNYYTITRFVYLLLACNLILIYRDGLTSIVIFTFVNMMPLAVIVFLHFLFPANPTPRFHSVGRNRQRPVSPLLAGTKKTSPKGNLPHQ